VSTDFNDDRECLLGRLWRVPFCIPISIPDIVAAYRLGKSVLVKGFPTVSTNSLSGAPLLRVRLEALVSPVFSQ
jgi:hypothetical protein